MDHVTALGVPPFSKPHKPRISRWIGSILYSRVHCRHPGLRLTGCHADSCVGALAEWPIAVDAVIRHGRTATVRWAPGLVVGTAAVLAFLLWTKGPAS